MPELDQKQLDTIHKLDGRTADHYKELCQLFGKPDYPASIEAMAKNSEVTYNEFSVWLATIQLHAEMIASNCSRIQDVL